MTALTKDIVLNALKSVRGPNLQSDIVALNMVSDIFIADGKVFFSITVPAEQAQELEPMRLAAEKVVNGLSGVKAALVTLTAEKEPGLQKPSEKPSEKTIVAQPGSSRSSTQHAPHQTSSSARTPVAGVRHIIAVASGKGGVGKSTTALNLALALSNLGFQTGVLDGDVYGPSLPRLTAMVDQKPQVLEGKTLKPLEKFGLKLMSMGFLVEEDKPFVWRGPMVMSAIKQMLRDVAWGPLDVLIVDMPPGTGDAQLTLAQEVALSGAVIVSTPQDLALVDARKGLEMFLKVGVPILGMVENMSYFIAPDTGKRYEIFGHGGARQEAQQRGVPFLGQMPLDPAIREGSDAGEPIFLSMPESENARLYKDMAKDVAKSLAL